MNRAVLAAFGDELLSGLRLERNCNWLASKLHDAGWEVMALEILPDREESVDDFLRRWVGHVDLIVTSGGLGSTHDDQAPDLPGREFARFQSGFCHARHALCFCQGLHNSAGPGPDH